MVDITQIAHDWVEIEHEGEKFEFVLNCNQHRNHDCHTEELEKIKRMSFEDVQQSYDVVTV